MPLEIGLWKVNEGPTRLTPAPMPLESKLEGLLEQEPDMLGMPLLIIGRQVPTAHGKFIDLLAVDGDGAIHVLELKRDKTPRDVVAQALDYGSWIESLGHEDVLSLFESYRSDLAFEEAFSERFGVSPPEELNGAHHLTVVASEVDAATERIVEYLARYDVPLNVLFFRYFTDGESQFLARTWLVDERSKGGTKATASGKKATKEQWNGQDWYVSFGENERRSWDDALKYGFVSAGGGAWYSRTLRSLPIGARIFVCIPGTGYVGVGTVIGEAEPFPTAHLEVAGTATPMTSLPLATSYIHKDPSPDALEYVVPVQWIRTRTRDQAIWEKGYFANQNSACKLRNRFTLDGLVKQFKLDDV